MSAIGLQWEQVSGKEITKDPESATRAERPAQPRSSATSTLITLGVFLVVCGGLAVAPVPQWLKPLSLTSSSEVKSAARRVFAKPKMTLQHVEEKLAAQSDRDGRDAPEGHGIDQEERELLATRDARADVTALEPMQELIEERPKAVRVDRAAIVARAKSPKADHFRQQAKSVHAPGAVIDNPCVVEDCTRRALDPFYATLDAIAAGDRQARAAAVVVGNSLIASDHVTDVVRARLVERFGSGGRGFLLPDRLSKVAGRRVRTGEGTPGWIIETFAQEPMPKEPFGFSGSVHVSSTAGERTSWRIDDATRARLFYVEHAGQPAFRIEARSQKNTRVIARVEAITDPAVPARDESLDIEIPPATSELVLVAEGKGARIYGVALENDNAGVLVDTIGVPAASARIYVEGVNEDAFVRQLAQREPALFVAMLGGNEVRGLSFGNITREKFDAYLTTLIQRAKKAAPQSACMIVSPIDAVKATAAGEELTTRPEIHTVIEVERAVAKKEGCAFFDLFAAMGGAGSLARFKEKGFLSDDLVHPTWKGGDVLGQLFADALLQSYVDSPPPPDGIAVMRRRITHVRHPVYAGLSFPAEESPIVVKKGEGAPSAQRRALQRFFDKLRALERGETSRVAIGQLGASHTAGQMWTDRMRARLGDRFGLAGRGFVSVGRESKRLLSSGVERDIEGGFEIADGREVVLGGAVGMSGTKARLEPGARFGVTFASSKSKRQAMGWLQLAWLYTPDMGEAEVAVDGKTVAILSPEERRLESDVQFLRIPVDGESASLEVLVRGPDPKAKKKDLDGEEHYGPVNLLSVVEERDRPGIVLDAAGLPGTTGMTPQRWRQDLIAEEVRARNYDLVVTAWGTNEAGISSLDEATYHHHFARTLDTLMEASPNADCLIVGASDRLDERNGEWRSAPAHDLVERVQRQIAADRGCAFFSLRTAMGGAGSMKSWVAKGLGNPDHVHFTQQGYEKLADLIVDDLLAAYAYDALLVAEAIKAAAVDRRGG